MQDALFVIIVVKIFKRKLGEMKKKEMREVTITYCDYCHKEITPPYSSIEYKDGRKVDLCSDFKEGEKNCKEKYLEVETGRRKE